MKDRRIAFSLLLIAFVALLAINACSDHGTVAENHTDDNDSTVSFTTAVHPLLLFNCGFSGCHIGANPQHEFSVATYATITEISHYGRHVVSGFADSSALYLVVTARYAEVGIPDRMPFGRTPLSVIDQNKIRDWINQGAKDN
jgi:hypothetical protein